MLNGDIFQAAMNFVEALFDTVDGEGRSEPTTRPAK
jgi:hypothetical protein